MDDVTNTSVNSVEVAEPQTEVANTEVTQEPTSVESNSQVTEVEGDNPQPEVADEPQGQSPEVNAAYAKARREFEARKQQEVQRAKDELIASQGMEWNGKPITTEAEYKQALVEKQAYDRAIAEGQSPEIAQQLAEQTRKNQELEERVSNFERQNAINQQEAEFKNDEFLSPIYNQYSDEIRNLADLYNVDINTAWSLFVGNPQNLKTIIENQTKNVEQTTIQNIQSNGIATPGSLVDEAQTPQTPNFKTMSKAEFEKYREARLNSL